MKKEIGIRPTTEQKYFKFLTYIYSKTQTPTILKSAGLSAKFSGNKKNGASFVSSGPKGNQVEKWQLK